MFFEVCDGLSASKQASIALITCSSNSFNSSVPVLRHAAGLWDFLVPVGFPAASWRF